MFVRVADAIKAVGANVPDPARNGRRCAASEGAPGRSLMVVDGHDSVPAALRHPSPADIKSSDTDGERDARGHKEVSAQ
jgi:hypothetical protein